jgi:hypothetical protein
MKYRLGIDYLSLLEREINSLFENVNQVFAPP